MKQIPSAVFLPGQDSCWISWEFGGGVYNPGSLIRDCLQTHSCNGLWCHIHKCAHAREG